MRARARKKHLFQCRIFYFLNSSPKTEKVVAPYMSLSEPERKSTAKEIWLQQRSKIYFKSSYVNLEFFVSLEIIFPGWKSSV